MEIRWGPNLFVCLNDLHVPVEDLFVEIRPLKHLFVDLANPGPPSSSHCGRALQRLVLA